MWSRLFSIWPIFLAIIVISLVLSASACFHVVAPGSAYGNQFEASPAPTVTVTVTATPPAPSSNQPAAAAISTASISPGIVGIWHFDNNALDSSGLGNGGLVIEKGTFVDGSPGFGKALGCSGISLHSARVPGSPSLDTSTSLTIEAWVKLDSLPDRSNVVSKVNKDNSQNSYSLQISADGHVGLSVWKSLGVTTFLRGDTLLELGKWYHIAGSYEFEGEGTSVMKVFVNDKLDGRLTDAVGPIYKGTAELMMGRLDGTVDEVHVWNTPYAAYALTAAPKVDINQPGASHTITANVTPAAPGVNVHFEVLPEGVNHGQSGVANTDSNGVATWTYTDKSLHGGIDNVRAWIDRDWSGSFDASNDASIVLRELWLDNFVTGSGNVMDGNRVAWTFRGSVGIIGIDAVGEFELVDQVRQVTYHSNSFNTLKFQEPPAGSPPVSSNTAFFYGPFTNNKDANTEVITFWMTDAGEQDSNKDKISVKTGSGPGSGTIWIGTPNPDWTSGPGYSSYAVPVPISNGEIKVYKTK